MTSVSFVVNPPMPSSPTILWFREDLRLADHAAVAAAAESGAPVIPLYVLDETPERRPLGAASRWWLDKSLRAHAGALETLGSRLVLRRGRAVEAVLDLVAETGATTARWSRSVEGFGRAEDAALADALAERGVEARAFLTHLMVDPDATRTGGGTPYQVFGAFRRAVLPRFGEDALLPAPSRLPAPAAWPASEALDAWGLHPTRPDWSTGFSDWTPGEAGARTRLDRFVDVELAGYQLNRDRPHLEGTTRLSPHLRFGEISPRQVVHAARAAAAADPALESVRDKFESELAWREFSYNLLAQRPDLAAREIRPAFARFPYRPAAKELRAWQAGRTGYPIVDAGMRQLWTTGWMHNRVRLIAASFLVKHLLVDWREGERWFWDTLVDADPANNPASWQWIAGSGVDASPYFRIFNPVAQGERFDPAGEYVRRWVPELAAVPKRFIHQPWMSPDPVKDYPAPLVDHEFARRRALDAFATMRAERQV